MNKNTRIPSTEANILFVDMNSFFASCEQQVNYWIRNRPVWVCVYTGKFGCIISPSVEAKKQGVKTGMRLNEAMLICPDLIPVETHPDRYREYHVKIINVLKRYSEEVIPKSIDEALVSLRNYKLIYKSPAEVAKRIKTEIKNKVGDVLTCSIGIAPNAFLAKLASNLKKPDGLEIIDEENIDKILSSLVLQDLPGIGKNTALTLQQAGIDNPLQLRHAPPERIRAACKSIVGYYWHCRLNFMEVDMTGNSSYKSMQAQRHISSENRKSEDYLNDLLLSLCMTLEKRMVRQGVFCNEVGFYAGYDDGTIWKDSIRLETPLQDGVDAIKAITARIRHYEANANNSVINNKLVMMAVSVSRFVSENNIQYDMFSNKVRKDVLRKAVYTIKEKYGNNSLLKAAELHKNKMPADLIGFGSVKDMHAE